MLTFEGAAVYAALVGGILLMRSHLNFIERTVILTAAMILTALHAAADTTICGIFIKHHVTSIIICRLNDKIIIGDYDRSIHR